MIIRRDAEETDFCGRINYNIIFLIAKRAPFKYLIGHELAVIGGDRSE